MRFITMTGAPVASTPTSCTGTTFGCSSAPVTHASRRMRRAASWSPMPLRSVFTATCRPSVACVARCTTPIPPSPMVWCTSILPPSVAPSARSASSAAIAPDDGCRVGSMVAPG